MRDQFVDDAQRRRWMRPDAHLHMRTGAWRYLRQDHERYLPPGALAAKANFDPEQPRDEQGRWADGTDVADSADVTVESIMTLANQFAAAGYTPTYLRCLDICSPLLDRWQPIGSDRNKYDYHRCMSICVGK